MAAISLATLYKDNKSGRLARTFKFNTSSSKPKYPKTSSLPTSASNGNSSMPSVCSFLKYFGSTPSSSKEQHIPLDSTPRITPFLISPPGSLAPTRATMTFNPTLAFGAPQTICSTPNLGPKSTFKICK